MRTIPPRSDVVVAIGLALGIALGVIGSLAGQTKDPPAMEPAAKESVSKEAASKEAAPKSSASDLAAEIAKLIAQLGDNEYATRQRAQERLTEIGPDAFDALTESQSHEDPEIAARSRFLLKSIRVELTKDNDPVAVRQLMKDYQSQDAAKRLLTIQALARLSEPGAVAVLCRLARYEQTELLAKQAAVAVIAQKLLPSSDEKQRAQQIKEALGGSQRAAVRWLRAVAEAGQGGGQRVQADWARFADEEVALLRRAPTRSSAEVAAGLLKFHVELLVRLGREKDIPPVLTQLVEVQPEDDNQLSDLIEWIQAKKAWSALEAIQKRFGERIEKEPILLYSVASARAAQGNAKLADELAAKALRFNPDNLNAHRLTGLMLHHRGMLRWAENEFRQLSVSLPANNVYAMIARYVLAELLHDQERNGEAGKMLEETVAAMQKNIKEGTPENNRERDLGSVKARMHYYLALDVRERDIAKHEELLDKALEADPTEADALIALYRLPKPDAARRAKTSKQIQEAVDLYRQQIVREADQTADRRAQAYNQLAWLVGNTEGNYQEALDCSLKSLELKPNTSAYLDTLGRCYYAVKDYSNALKHQRMATEQDPHSKQMQRQLALFEKAAGEKPSEGEKKP